MSKIGKAVADAIKAAGSARTPSEPSAAPAVPAEKKNKDSK
ncbi:hypothetical protein V6U90_25540 [Micromonospora sp. CPCC 206060]